MVPAKMSSSCPIILDNDKGCSFHSKCKDIAIDQTTQARLCPISHFSSFRCSARRAILDILRKPQDHFLRKSKKITQQKKISGNGYQGWGERGVQSKLLFWCSRNKEKRELDFAQHNKSQLQMTRVNSNFGTAGKL